MAESINHGKWSQPGVPHSGWTCVDVEDLLAPNATCEMCEARDIRYVHFMTHPGCTPELRVGAICAGHMEGNQQAALDREQQLKRTAGRRARWLTRGWRESAKGNSYLKAGYIVTVFPSKWGGFAFSVKPEIGTKPVFSRRRYETPDRAKLAPFEQLTRMSGGAA